eukprot:403376264
MIRLQLYTVLHVKYQLVLILSKFQLYSQNALRLLDEYSVENVKAELINQNENESQLKSSQFNKLIDKVKRMLSNVVSKEEYQQIDLQQYLEDPQNNQFERSNSFKLPQMDEEEKNNQNNLNQEEIKLLIKESQTQLIEEFNQAVSVFQNSQDQFKQDIHESIQQSIKSIKDNFEKTQKEFEIGIESNLYERFQSIDSLLETGKIKINNLDQNVLGCKNQCDQINEDLQYFKLEVNIEVDKQEAFQLDTKAKIDTLQQRINQIYENKHGNSLNNNESEQKLLATIEKFKTSVEKNFQDNSLKFEKFSQDMNKQEQNMKQFEQQQQNLQTSFQDLLLTQDKQEKQFSEFQSQIKQSLDENLKKITEKLDTANLKFESDLKTRKKDLQAFDDRVICLEESIRTIKSSSQKEMTQFKSAFDSLQANVHNLQQEKESLMQRTNFQTLVYPDKKDSKLGLNQQMPVNIGNNKHSLFESEQQFIQQQIYSQKQQNNPPILPSQGMSRQTKLVQNEELKSQNLNHQQIQREAKSLQDDLKKGNSTNIKKLFRDLVDQELNKIESCILKEQISDYSAKKFNLLYSGSRDGFRASKFHQNCDDKGPTVTFILSEYGQVFGGYTSISWQSPDQWESKSDNKAFVFNITKGTIHKNYMCGFGGWL